MPKLYWGLWAALFALAAIKRWPARSVAIVFILSALWTTWQAQQQLNGRLPAEQDGTVTTLNGHITDLPEADAIRSRFMFESVDGRRLRLSWYGDYPTLAPGDCYQITAKLSAPHGSANPGTFDYESWLWQKRIAATGYIKSAQPCSPASTASSTQAGISTRFSAAVDAMRLGIIQRMDAILNGHAMQGVIEALTVGVKNQISDEQWSDFRRTGTSHLVAISGLHIGLIAGWLLVVSRWLLLRLPMRLPVLSCAAAVALLGGGFYSLLAGMALPSLRAVIMLAIGLVALWRVRSISFSRVLALAAICVVVVNPFAVLGAGFWLSFGAVAWIVYLSRTHLYGRWWLFVRVQVGIGLGLMPITLLFFNQASVISPLVNAVLIPLAAVYVPVLLCCVALLFIWPVVGAGALAFWADGLQWFWQGVDWIAQWPWASLEQPAHGLLASVLALLGLALVFLPRGFSGRYLGVILILPLLFGWQPTGDVIPKTGFDMAVLDVGQGLAVVVQTQNHVLVYDAGPRYRTGFDAGAAIVTPYLQQQQIRKIDKLVISHADNDHIGGAAAIKEQFNVAQHLGAGDGLDCVKGQSWRWDGVHFEVLYPVAQEQVLAEQDISKNNRSCVVLVASPHGRVLLTGDIETQAEQRLLAVNAHMLQADIVTVPHHGSRTSSTPKWLAAVSPDYALVSSGWHNRWGHPHEQVVARYKQAGATVLNTADSGALLVQARPNQPLKVQRWRQVQPRIWHVPTVTKQSTIE